ncbi:MAG: NBR1-Ig-like domain-containing protein [Anaerolineales bacterium]|nr:MAG: NBR1-Ig-like domain-containing protein [Anaerolineales bacterium]
MKTRILTLVMLLTMGVLLFSCGIKDSAPSEKLDGDAIRTEAVATYASSLTGTLSPPAPASPAPTVGPTRTPPVITATIEASPTVNPCYNLMYIADVTIPDGMEMKAGEVFTKAWRVQNIGGCAWRAGFTFQHVGGDLMRGSTITLPDAIQTGSIREISIQLVVPSGQSGLIQSAWRMADENGNFFGDTLSVNIVVGNNLTSTVTSAP